MSVSVSFSPHPRLCKTWGNYKMSVSLEPVDVPETIESETNPTPTQIEESESNPTDEAPEPKGTRSNEAREPIPLPTIHKPTQLKTSNAPGSIQGDENPVKKRGRPSKEVPKEPKTPKAAPKKTVRMKPPSPVNEVNESNSEEETPLTRDGMGTL